MALHPREVPAVPRDRAHGRRQLSRPRRLTVEAPNTENGRPENFRPDGRPEWSELCHAALTNAALTTGHDAERWLRLAEVDARMAQAEQMQDLARSNRELAAAMQAVADEHRARRA